jgi:DNA-directed RNA polymerase specialized sigma24 family protein
MLNLILDARNGNQEACTELIGRMYDIIRIRCCKRVGGQLAEDAAQETAMLVLRKIHQFKGNSVAEFNAWLGMVCRSGAQRAVAKSVRPRERGVSEEALQRISCEDDLSHIDSKILVEQMRATPLREDVDLLLSVAGSKSQLAIATERNVGCRTLKTQVFRAKERLRLHMCA